MNKTNGGMKKIIMFVLCLFIYFSFAWGQASVQQYAGTAMPYPFIENSSTFSSDGMIPFYINHLGRHGARFPTSGKDLNKVIEVLTFAECENRLTAEGVELLSTVRYLAGLFKNQWGKLSKLGEQEQKGIAGRMIEHYPLLFTGAARIEAIATYVPRCINSMDAFLSVIKQHNSALYIERSEGRQYDTLLRFFDFNKSYVCYKKNGEWIPVYEAFLEKKISPAPVMKRLFLNPEQETNEEARKFVRALFAIAAILPDTDISLNLENFFTTEEWFDYWQTQNLRQYLSKSAAPIGKMLPVAIAWPLLSEFIRTAEEVINGQSNKQANFRFAHAETVIPFVVLLGIEKTDSSIANPDSVALYWKDYEIAPMAANVQWIFYRDNEQNVWIKILLNEQEAALPLATDRFPYYQWEEVHNFLSQRILMAQKILSSLEVTDEK